MCCVVVIIRELLASNHEPKILTLGIRSGDQQPTAVNRYVMNNLEMLLCTPNHTIYQAQ